MVGNSELAVGSRIRAFPLTGVFPTHYRVSAIDDSFCDSRNDCFMVGSSASL